MAVTNPLPTPAIHPVRLGDICASAGLLDPSSQAQLPARPLISSLASRQVTGVCQVVIPSDIPSGIESGIESGLDDLQPGWLAVAELPDLPEPRGDLTARTFIRRLAARSAAGLVLRTERGVSEALLDEARFADLPVYCLPADGSIAAFIRGVHQSTSSAEVALLHRALAIQTTLLGALAATDPPTEMVQRLGQQLGVSVVLYDHRQAVLASHGEAPVHLISNCLATAAVGTATKVGRWQVQVESIEVDTGRLWLALASQDDGGPGSDLARSVRQAVEQLLRAHARTVAASRAQDQVQRAQILAELLDGVTESRLARLRDRLVLLQFGSEGSFVVHLIDAGDRAGERAGDRAGDRAIAGEASMDPTLAVAQELADDLGIGILVGRHGDNRVILHPVHEQFSRQLVEQLPNRVHGASSAFSDLTGARTGLRQAEMSQATSRRSESFTPFHRVGFIDFVLGHVPQDALAEKAREVLGDLDDTGPLIETLVEYLRHDLDIAATCQALHVHANSIRYRLKRAEDRLGRSLADPETIALLYLTLHQEIRGQRLRPSTRLARTSA